MVDQDFKSKAKAEPFLVRGKHVLLRATDDQTVETVDDGAILQVDGAIAEIGAFDDLVRRHPGVPVIGDENSLVIPGLVNSHHHIGMTPIQMGSPDLPLELWLTHQMRHKSIDPYLDTLYSAFELIASGVTAVQHLGRMRPAPVADWPKYGLPSERSSGAWNCLPAALEERSSRIRMLPLAASVSGVTGVPPTPAPQTLTKSEISGFAFALL